MPSLSPARGARAAARIGRPPRGQRTLQRCCRQRSPKQRAQSEYAAYSGAVRPHAPSMCADCDAVERRCALQLSAREHRPHCQQRSRASRPIGSGASGLLVRAGTPAGERTAPPLCSLRSSASAPRVQRVHAVKYFMKPSPSMLQMGTSHSLHIGQVSI
jgi:hypothetical protein